MIMINEIDYDKLKVDKENNSVYYNDEVHKYWTKNSKQNCISVTTLIHKFTNFDEDFWSSYKALESLVSPEQFTEVKPSLLDSKRFTSRHLEITSISEKDFLERKQEILKEWEVKRETSCIRGTAIHKVMEDQNLLGKTKEIKSLGLGGTFKPITTNKIELGSKGIYPELLLSRISDDGKLRIAGQADLIIVDGYDVYILDYKTNKKIDQKSYFDRKKKKYESLSYPLNNIQDCNYMHYSLQLSTYAWMIQKEYPEANIKLLMLIHYDHDGNVENYECEYLKNDVEKMLVFYKKQIEHEEFRKSREKIVF